MPKKQTTAGKKARAAARAGEKYTTALRGQLSPGTGPAAMSPATGPACPQALEHRALMDEGPGWRPFRGTGLFGRIGGQQAVSRLVDLLYEGIRGDEQLRPLFPRDLAGSRSRQKLFFAEWLDGPGRYSEQAYAGLRHSHDGLPVTAALADRWLGHLRGALEATVAAGDDREAIAAAARSLAMRLVSGQVAPARPTGRGSGPRGKAGHRGAPDSSAPGNSGPQVVAWCGIGARSVTRARHLAHRGDAAGLGATLARAPDLLLPSYAAAIMQAAALAGRAEIIAMLLERGVGADHPFFLPVSVTGRAFERVVFVTPLCAARMKRRLPAESLLVAAGAREDVFTAAFLGDRGRLARMLAGDPGLAQAADPAVDVVAITPVDHAVAGGQADALRLLLDHAADPPAGYTRALRGAAEQGSVVMAALLLAQGADATRIGAGRWVLHPELAPLLAGHGAAIDSSGSWIGASCTGNQGRTDDPDYVRALLRHGARATDRRGTLPGERGNRTVPRTMPQTMPQTRRPASAPSTRPRCTTLPGQASCGPSRCSSSTEQTPAPATAAAARRWTGWKKRRRQCRGPPSGTCSPAGPERPRPLMSKPRRLVGGNQISFRELCELIWAVAPARRMANHGLAVGYSVLRVGAARRRPPATTRERGSNEHHHARRGLPRARPAVGDHRA